MITFPSQHNLITSFSLMQVLRFSINMYCISQFSSLWRILYTLWNSTVMYKNIAHLLMGSSRTSDLPELSTSIEGSSNLTQGQGFECYKRVSLLYQICYSFF